MNSTRVPGVNPADLAVCRDLLRRGSRTFFAASLLLPRAVRRRVAPVYAFCRTADDLVDLNVPDHKTITRLEQRVDRIYRGESLDEPVDRALAAVVAQCGIPRKALDTLIEGFSWEVDGRPYESLADVHAYSMRVAATVGVAVTYTMTRPSAHTLARACDLGVAMQLTNIARDVGEDGRRGRVYLPQAWLRDEGLDPDTLRGQPRFTPALGRVVQRLLEAADRLYERSHAGIASLPARCRPAIRAASAIYRDIGRVIAASDYDSVTRRAYTTGRRKLALAAGALAPRRSSALTTFHAPPLAEATFLVHLGDSTPEPLISQNTSPV
ncbi:MAG: phytoene/squalene synthase family protein [Gemmatimonadota bacterium]|nr:phytoene/squalene synthase family protein [Gemmatimonadota bacterium]